jgi:hypothetical protein
MWRCALLAISVSATVGYAQVDAPIRERLTAALGDTATVTRFLSRWSLFASDSERLRFVDRRPSVAGPLGHRFVQEMDIDSSSSTLIRFEVSCESGHMRARSVVVYSDRAARHVASIDSVPEDWSTARPSPSEANAVLVTKACG